MCRLHNAANDGCDLDDVDSERGLPDCRSRHLIRRIRLVAGLIMFSYLISHFTNHMLGLVSLDAMEAALRAFYGFWSYPVVPWSLYGAFAVHFSLALWALWQRRTLRMPIVMAVQYVLGFTVPLLALQHVTATRIFADLRAFTRLAETKLPYDVVFMLNRYFAAMGQAIEEAGGRVDKFIGDGIMALFGIEEGAAAGCRHSLEAARLMSLRLQDLNRALEHEIDAPLRTGIGIHVGPVIVGRNGIRASDTAHRSRRCRQHGEPTRGAVEGIRMRAGLLR